MTYELRGGATVVIIPILSMLAVMLVAVAVVMSKASMELMETSREEAYSRGVEAREELAVYLYNTTANQSTILVLNKGGTHVNVDYFAVIMKAGDLLSQGGRRFEIRPGGSLNIKPEDLGIPSEMINWDAFSSQIAQVILHTENGGVYTSDYQRPEIDEA